MSFCPKSAAEEIGYTFLPCVLAGLSNAPQYVVSNSGSLQPGCVVASDVDSVILPPDICGGDGVLAFTNSKQNKPLMITVRKMKQFSMTNPINLELKRNGGPEELEEGEWIPDEDHEVNDPSGSVSDEGNYEMMILLLKWNVFASALQHFVYVEHGPLFCVAQCHRTGLNLYQCYARQADVAIQKHKTNDIKRTVLVLKFSAVAVDISSPDSDVYNGDRRWLCNFSISYLVTKRCSAPP